MARNGISMVNFMQYL